MDEHLGYQKSERSDNLNYRNGTKKKKVRSNYGEFELDVPQDRDSSFEPRIVKKRQKDISGIDQKIISMYARGMTTRYNSAVEASFNVLRARIDAFGVVAPNLQRLVADRKSVV